MCKIDDIKIRKCFSVTLNIDINTSLNFLGIGSISVQSIALDTF